jgi:hypothetical protein
VAAGALDTGAIGRAAPSRSGAAEPGAPDAGSDRAAARGQPRECLSLGGDGAGSGPARDASAPEDRATRVPGGPVLGAPGSAAGTWCGGGRL